MTRIYLLWVLYKIVFNMSESLLFITKEVIGSQHRKFPIQIYNYFYASIESAIESKVKYCASAAGG